MSKFAKDKYFLVKLQWPYTNIREKAVKAMTVRIRLQINGKMPISKNL